LAELHSTEDVREGIKERINIRKILDIEEDDFILLGDEKQNSSLNN
jgi:hypothetical protein